MIDTHAHYNLKNFDCDRDRLLQQLHQELTEYIVIPAISYESSEQSMNLFAKYDWIYYSVGIHPNFVGLDDSQDAEWEAGLPLLAGRNRVVAVGETGLDYHRFTCEEDGTLSEESAIRKQRQHLWFRRHLNLAVQADLPLVLHVRAAHEDGLKILKEYDFRRSCPGVIHCFNGTAQEVKGYTDRGFMVGLGGSVTYGDPDLEEAVRQIPDENMVLETDAPYVLPAGLPGKRNTSLNLPVIVEKIALLRGTTPEKIIEITTKNAHRLFEI